MKLRLMSTNFAITGELEKYTQAKVSKLMRKLPRAWRAQAECVIECMQKRQKGATFSTCKVIFTAKNYTFQAEETTQHMYAAFDIAAVHIEQQLKAHAARLKPLSREWQIP